MVKRRVNQGWGLGHFARRSGPSRAMKSCTCSTRASLTALVPTQASVWVIEAAPIEGVVGQGYTT